MIKNSYRGLVRTLYSENTIVQANIVIALVGWRMVFGILKVWRYVIKNYIIKIQDGEFCYPWIKFSCVFCSEMVVVTFNEFMVGVAAAIRFLHSAGSTILMLRMPIVHLCDFAHAIMYIDHHSAGEAQVHYR